ncbi:MAG TPA: methylated-DNA--[protein]-cysteine S-methyltransferase [Thermoanaerobaculia bacterium]|nr:methylated-DNA--[protein]-cysteine S-methyltransferase [Thermoanaerobaculia bacterium]
MIETRISLARVLRGLQAVEPPPPPPEPAKPPPLRVLIPSPLGSLGVELTDRAVTGITIVPDRKQRRQFVPLRDADRSDFLDETLGRLSEYFAGARQELRIEYDLSGHPLDDFARRILEETTRIPYGTTRTYRKVASAAARGHSYRMVRAALMANPIPIVIPCHRVVPQKGGVGTYIGGTKKKAWLIKLEARVVEGA